MLEQIKSADWKKQEVQVTAKKEADFVHDGVACHIYLCRFDDSARNCGGKWNLQVRVGGYSHYSVSTSGIVDTDEQGMETAARIIPHLIAAFCAIKGS